MPIQPSLDRQAGRQTRQTDGQAGRHRETDGKTYKQMDGRMDRQKGRQTDGLVEGRTDEPKDK